MDSSSTKLQIIEGVFNVTVGGKSAELQAGFQMDILASMAEPPEAVKIDPAVLDSLKKEIKEKSDAGVQADTLGAAEDTALDGANEVFEALERANQGSCQTFCSYWQDGVCQYVYEHCESSQ